MSTVGILWINLGTPDAPTRPAVRRYLREFLSDPLVIDVPWLVRMLLVYGVILPFRPAKTAQAYQAIWTERGSPLLAYSQDFLAMMQSQLPAPMVHALGMRYGNPSLSDGVDQLLDAGCRKIIAMVMFPQYATAASGSAIKKLQAVLAKKNNDVELVIHDRFYNHPGYIDALSEQVARYQQSFQPDYILWSYHGLPQRQLDRAGCDASLCDRKASCLTQAADKACYRAQCFYTTALAAKQLALPQESYATVFQSRLGRTPWIEPYTDQSLDRLRAQGVQRLMVVCPSFVVDCLETL